MDFSYKKLINLLPLQLLLVLKILTLNTSVCSSVSAIYAFGDSLLDTGNNNYIKTYSKSNIPPYGVDFPHGIATGRFGNGKLITDFIAAYLGIKEVVPPYLDPTLSLQELMTGVCFASAGSGYDPLTTRIFKVIPIQKQLEYFREYKAKLELAIGKEQTSTHIQNAVFIVSSGTNDLTFTYLTVPTVRRAYTLEVYEQHLLQKAREFLEGLWNLGARRIGVFGIPPIGYAPIIRTVRSRYTSIYTALAKDLDQKLQNELASMQNFFAKFGGRLAYGDIYTPALDMVTKPQLYGLETTVVACCGTGHFETAYLCNSKSTICPDRSKYLFWDASHLTEKGYSIIFRSLQHKFIDYLAF